MCSRADLAGARALAAALFALAGCGNGDQVLGTIRPGESPPIQADSGPSIDATAGCSTSRQEVAREVGQGLDVYFTVDRSYQSMFDPMGDKWDRLVSAFTNFLHSGPLADIELGIHYFPAGGNFDACRGCPPRDCMCLAGCGCPCDMRGEPRNCQRNDMCDPGSYTRPEVEIGQMSQTAGPIAMSLFTQIPFGPTVIRPALRGALDHAASFASQHQNERVVEVLVAGGPPDVGNCQPDTIADCADVAADSNVKTYVVAFDYDGPSLDAIATRGGGFTRQFDSRREDVAMRFADLVREIANQRHCEYDLPQGFDSGPIGVQIKPPPDPGDGGPPTPLVTEQVKSRQACNNAARDWYFDRPDHPTRIVACDEMCRQIRELPGSIVQINVCGPSPP
jgi:hypothetical protein